MSSIKTQSHRGITWIDIGNPTHTEIQHLSRTYPFHSIHLEESLLTGHLPQVEREKDYVFLLLRVPGTDPKTGAAVSDQVAFFLGDNYLVTLHPESRDDLRKLFIKCETDDELSEKYFKHSAGHLLHHLLSGLLNHTATTVQLILGELDELEGVVFDEQTTASYQIGHLRQRILKLKRVIDLLDEVMADLVSNIQAFAGDDIGRHYRSLAKTAKRLSMALDEAKESIEIFKDADFTASSARTNEVLAVLTIIFTLTIPATILGTFYGMNIPLPGGLEMGAWTFWGPYTTFKIVVAGSVASALGMAWYFWSRRWF